MENIVNWFTGGKSFDYRSLVTGLGGDTMTAAIIIALCLTISMGYWFIVARWIEVEKNSPSNEAQMALSNLKWIFLLSGGGGFLLVALEVLWPAWRLYALFLLILLACVWRFLIRNTNGLSQIYTYLQDRDQLVREILMQKEMIADLRELVEARKKDAP